MPQMSLDRNYTPQRFVVELNHDPTQPELGYTLQARVLSAGGTVIGSGSCALIGVEVDLVGTMVERLVEQFMWGNGTQVHHLVRHLRREARAHAEKYEARTVGEGGTGGR